MRVNIHNPEDPTSLRYAAAGPALISPQRTNFCDKKRQLKIILMKLPFGNLTKIDLDYYAIALINLT